MQLGAESPYGAVFVSRRFWGCCEMAWGKNVQVTKKLSNISRALFCGGFFDIVGAGTLNKAIATIMSIVLVRVLSKYDYGVYSYAFNIASFFIIFNGLGATSAALQLCCEAFNDQDLERRIYAFAYRVSYAVGFAYLLIILVIALFIPLSIPSAGKILALYCAYPLLQQLCDIKTILLRVRLQNREYALSMNVQTVLMCVLSIAGAAVFEAIGLAIGQSLALLLSYIWLCWRFPFERKPLFSSGASLGREGLLQFWKIALISAFNSGVSQAFTLLGTMFIGMFTADELMVSSYRVASTIPFALLFFPSAIVTYIYPHFVRHKDDKRWTLRSYGLVTAGSILLVGLITVSFIVFARPIVSIIFGEQYSDAVPVMRLVMVGFFITAAFRTPAGNLLVTQRKLVTNSVIGIITIVVCFIASYALIPSFGMMGAAAVYVICMMMGAIMSCAAYLWTVFQIEA